MTELWQLGAHELSDRTRTEQVSIRKTLGAHLTRVELFVGRTPPTDPITA